MSRLSRSFLAGLALALPTLVPLAKPAQAGAPPRFFLSWNAPYGAPRATQDLAVTCGDDSRRDTLYVCFDPGRDSTELVAIDAEVRLWPAAGDTLDRHWWFESRSNPAQLKAEFNLEDAPGALRPWTEQGAGGIRTTTAPDSAKIKVVWAVGSRDRSMVHGGNVYGFARLIVPRPPRPETCARPVCFELANARIVYSVGSRDLVRRGARWVSWNRGNGDPCGKRARANPTTPWYPSSKRP